ncbi:hypothetical protein BOX15_Mlig007869g1 [Macrostomum lignano]|uniref:AAA+ ATPase domain-containing protein n=1 Tax=Macrostomum lignano TaxID=282301 RepID=A0A267GY58_9PLAT|nr:hypothetical protein BOX15_Mlig007869g1 [Macrostomum lignano]
MSNQLKKFYCSEFFKIKNLRRVFETDSNVRSDLVTFIIDSALQLTVLSLGSVQKQQVDTLTNVYERTANRFKSMLNWENSAHVMPVFQKQDISAVELVFRKLDEVPEELRSLFEASSSRGLTEFSELTEEQLLHRLVRIAAKGSPGDIPQISSDQTLNYRLTADNFLKMVLISLRIDADVPVLIMGETGCGKTSLIRFLANVQGVDLEVMNFHAGVEQEEIVKRIRSASGIAKEKYKEFVYSNACDGVVWVFLDEINTCEHLGLLKEAICHKKLLGERLPPNLRLMAACNPYVLRPKSSSSTAGFQTKELREDEMKSLVYRVHPLPESMVELVWDFGRLTDHDEQAYIGRILTTSLSDNLDDVQSELQLAEVVKCITVSQKFVRSNEESDYATSLRDVRRFCEFFHFFFEFFKKWNETGSENPSFKRNKESIAALFALYVCYYVRNSTSTIRKRYLETISVYFKTNADELCKEIEIVQANFIRFMKCPPKTAVNLALRENIFVLFCCIYARVPVFLVGKPGCSKSLAVSIIRSNFRGKDSEHPLFQQYPSLSFSSFQGSEASTSKGVKKVFESARNKLKKSGDAFMTPVVLIDEIGLAEKSRHNPLKVLHSLLEPQSALDCRCEVAVIGISNWALDPAKMNRAIHISRPDMTEEELYDTGKAILSDQKSITVEDVDQRKIAKACHEYLNKKQPFENFHGLRDFYYLLKYLSDQMYSEDEKVFALKEGLARNFNGLKLSHERALGVFTKHFPNLLDASVKTARQKSVAETMIFKNLQDPSARHLMLICDGDSCLDLLCNELTKEKRKFRVMHGSGYDKDQFSEEFTYRKLNEVIMCMEEGLILIFKDFDLLYGSLYDMLNQNYSEYANKKYCRIAMGTQANQNCVVHNNFRCIVLVNKTVVQDMRLMDPPFLNRFEKQPFSLKNTVDALELKESSGLLKKKVITLTHLVQNESKLEFKTSEVFLGFYDDLAFCYLINEALDGQRLKLGREPHSAFVDAAFKRLRAHMLPDSVLRCTFSNLPIEERKNYQTEYFSTSSRTLNKSFVDIIQDRAANCKPGQICKLYIYTKSSLFTKIESLETDSDFTVRDIRLMDFVRESDMIDVFSDFFRQDQQNGLMIIRVKPSIDENYVLHARCLLDDICKKYQTECKSKKFVVMLVQLQREDLKFTINSWKWNPLLDWQVDFVECICPEVQFSLSDLVFNNQRRFIEENESYLFQLFDKVVPQALMDVLRSQEEIQRALIFFKNNPPFSAAFRRFTLNESILFDKHEAELKPPFDSEHWLVRLSVETTRLSMYSSFHEFVLSSIEERLLQNTTKLLIAMSHYSLFEAGSWCGSVADSLMQQMFEYILREQSSAFESDRPIKFTQISCPYSPLVYSGFCKIFKALGHAADNCKNEMQTFLTQLGLERRIPVSDDMLMDFTQMATINFCGQDRSDGVMEILSYRLKNCDDLTDAVITILGCFDDSNLRLAQILNVHAYLRQRNVDVLCSDTEDLNERFENMLKVLVPSGPNFEKLCIKNLDEWRRIATNLLLLVRDKNERPRFLIELESLLKFFKFFAPAGKRIKLEEVISTYNSLQSRGLLSNDADSVLLEWKKESAKLFSDSSAPDEARLMLIESNFYYSLLHTRRLTEPLLNSILELLIRGRLPMGFASFLLSHITEFDDEENSLFSQFAEKVEEIGDATVKSGLFSILATTLKPSQLDATELLKSLEDLRPKLKSSFEINFSEVVDLVDAINFFSDAVKEATAVHNKFLCFGNDQSDVFAFLERCILTQKLHPFWLLFVRCLRQRYTLGELHSLFKLDHTASLLPTIDRDKFLRFGQSSQLASYCLRYPFLDCSDTNLYVEAVAAFSNVLVPGRPDYLKIKNFWKSISQYENQNQYYCDTLSIYIESVMFKKCFANFQSPEKALTREIKERLTAVSHHKLHPLLLISCSERDSCLDEANLTSQSSPGHVCLATLYYRTLLSFFIHWPPKPGSVVDELSKRDALDICSSEKIKPRASEAELFARHCTCMSVTVYKANAEEMRGILLYHCAFCESTDDKGLSKTDVTEWLDDKPVSSGLDKALQLLVSIYSCVSVDLHAKRTASQLTNRKPTAILDQLESLAKFLELSTEDCTWVLHLALRASSEFLFHQPATAGLQTARYQLACCLASPQSSIIKFKRDRLTERQLKSEFSYAWIVDGLDVDSCGSTDSCDEIDEAIATPRQFHLARNCLLFPKCKSDLNAICHLFNCHQVKVRGNPDDPADGEVNDKFGRFLEFVLRHRSVLSNSDHLRRLTIWHAAVAKQIDGQLSMEEFEAWRVEDFLKRYPDCKAMHDNAQVAWNCLHPNALMLNLNNPLHLKRPLRRALFTELSPLIDTAKPLLCDQNEFLIAAAGLALTETCEALEPLLSASESFDSTPCCHLATADLLSSPDRLPALSADKLTCRLCLPRILLIVICKSIGVS